MRNVLKLGIILFIIAALCAFLFMGYKFYGEYHEYEVADTEYKTTSEKTEIAEENISLTEEEEKKIKKEKKELIFPENTNREDFPDKNVDFYALKQINMDAIGWIYCDELKLDYPIVQSDDNQKYLDYTFEGTKNSSGCIFLDNQCPSDFTDMNSFIFGHQMKNGTMFGSLKTINKDKEMLKKPIYIYIYTTTGIIRYKTVSCYVAKAKSYTYEYCDNAKDLRDYINNIYRDSVFKSTIPQGDIKKLITLSTCHGAHGTPQRFVVHAAMIDKYYYKNK